MIRFHHKSIGELSQLAENGKKNRSRILHKGVQLQPPVPQRWLHHLLPGSYPFSPPLGHIDGMAAVAAKDLNSNQGKYSLPSFLSVLRNTSSPHSFPSSPACHCQSLLLGSVAIVAEAARRILPPLPAPAPRLVGNRWGKQAGKGNTPSPTAMILSSVQPIPMQSSWSG